jgi:hypothetical protein
MSGVNNKALTLIGGNFNKGEFELIVLYIYIYIYISKILKAREKIMRKVH